MLSKIYNLLRYCYEDSIEAEIAGMEFQLFIISAKSLLPYEEQVGCMFDTNRYKKEAELFSYYKNGRDTVVEGFLNKNEPSSMEDVLLEYKILPIVTANTAYDTIIEEALKCVLLFTVNIHSVINTVILSSVIHEYLSEDFAEAESIKYKTKERLIQFSLKDFMVKNKLNPDKGCLIDFEKERVKMMMKDGYLTDNKLIESRALQFIINNRKSTKEVNLNNEAVLNNFAAYLLKLRKGTLNPEKLRIDVTKEYDFKSYLRNSSFTHPLLGRCTVVKRNDREIILKNKVGLLKVNI